MTPSCPEHPKDLYKICHAAVKSKLLVTAIEFKIFNLLSEPKTGDEIAEMLNTHPKNTMLFLNALVACNLLRKEGGGFRNAPIARKFLTEGSPTSLGEGFARQAAITERVIKDLPKLILEGPPDASSEITSVSKEKWAENTAWLGNAARSGIARQMADIIEGLPEFPHFRRMLDLGGSHGIYCITMVKRHPTMTGTLFDFKPVVEAAKRFIEEYRLEDRIDVLAGDYNQDSIGQGYNLIWASSSLNFARRNMDIVMKKIYNALTPDGIFVNLSEGLTGEGTQPAIHTLYKVGMAMSNPVTPFERGFIADAMYDAGFTRIRSITLDTGWGEKDLDIARK